MSRTRQSGFNLLEVTCAFAILALVSGLMVVLYYQSMQKASTAIDRRELREIADTMFGKILFEEEVHNDGDSRTMDDAYGNWANLPQASRERYARYRYVLEKKLVTASGVADPNSDAEPLFETSTDTDERDRLRGSSSRDETARRTEEAGEDATGVELWKYVLRFYDTEVGMQQGQELMVLQTYRRPNESAAERGRTRR